jgi:sporulation protein YlmC with PRC-barrel domain
VDQLHGVQLVHDVLDACLTDRTCRKVGRVDELVITLTDGEQPRVSTILIGGPVRAQRIGRWMVKLRAMVSAILHHEREVGVSRVPFSAVREIGETIELDVDAATLPSGHLERWLGDHIIDHIPGSHGEKK